MNLNRILIKVKDVCIREPLEIFKRYNPHQQHNKKDKTTYIFMVDGTRPHGGMFDRIKGILSTYAVAMSYDASFKIYFKHPFDLEKYLEPNLYDWANCTPIYQYPQSRPLIMYGECFHPERLLKKRTGEIHVYYGFDSLDVINKRFGTHYVFGDLYQELFKPTPYIQQYIDAYKKEIGGKYVACHVRFMNLLGEQIEAVSGGYKILPDAEKNDLMNSVAKRIQQISDTHKDCRIMLATDSNKFSEQMKNRMPSIYVVPGTVKHVDTAGDTSDEENIKLFLDYYLISDAEKVYSIVGGPLYPSQFPKYSARIGKVPYEHVWANGYDSSEWIVQ